MSILYDERIDGALPVVVRAAVLEALGGQIPDLEILHRPGELAPHECDVLSVYRTTPMLVNPLHLVPDNLPAHKTAAVRRYVDELKGKLTLHFLPGYAPDLNPDELVWRYAKRTGAARNPLRAGEKLVDRVHEKLSEIETKPALVKIFLQIPRCRLYF